MLFCNIHLKLDAKLNIHPSQIYIFCIGKNKNQNSKHILIPTILRYFIFLAFRPSLADYVLVTKQCVKVIGYIIKHYWGHIKHALNPQVSKTTDDQDCHVFFMWWYNYRIQVLKCNSIDLIWYTRSPILYERNLESSYFIVLWQLWCMSKSAD